MSAEITFLPQSTDVSSFASKDTTNTIPPFATSQSPSLTCFPYLTDDTWLDLNHLLSQPRAPSQASSWNPAPSPQRSQNQKRRNHSFARNGDPRSPNKSRDDVERQKREAFLARNRRAATKCRQKKREFTERLKGQYDDVSKKKASLESDLAQLQREVLELKNELLRHSQCADPAIQNHLAGMVKCVTVARSPELALSCPTSGFNAAGDSSIASGVPGHETGRTRRDSVLSISTDVSLDSFLDDSLFEDLVNDGHGGSS